MSIYQSCRKMCPDLIVSDFVAKIIETVPVRPGYNTVRVTLKSDRPTDKTFCALTTLSVVCRKGCLVDIVDVVVKSAPKNKKLRGCIPVNGLFAREAFFYNTVLVELLKFQDEVEVVHEDKFQGAQILIAATLVEGEETVILHNSGIGCPKYEKWVGELTREHIFVVLKDFARFHALTFAFGKNKPERLEEFRKELQGGFLSTLENDLTEKIVKENLGQILKFCSDGNVVKKLKKFEDELGGFFGDVLNRSDDFSVLIHGDPTANFLFSYEKSENNNAPSRSKVTDWQLVKFGSPVLDLSLFLFTNCSLEDLHTIKFLKHYHSNLENFSKEYKCAINDVFPLNRLEEQWKKLAKFGLALSFITLKIISLESNKKPNANNENSSCEEFLEAFVQPPSDEFIRRIKDIVRYCIEEELI